MEEWKVRFGALAGSELDNTDGIFIAIDTEWVCNSLPPLLTEIGISSFDVRDARQAAPGDLGTGLRPHIKDKHFVISENRCPGHGIGSPAECPEFYKWDHGDIDSAMFCTREDISLDEIKPEITKVLRQLGCMPEYYAELESYKKRKADAAAEKEKAMDKKVEEMKGALEKAQANVESSASSSWVSWGDAFRVVYPPDSPAWPEADEGYELYLSARTVYLLFHDPEEDVKLLKYHGIDFNQIYPCHIIVDTQRCSGAKTLGTCLTEQGRRPNAKVKLVQLIDYAGVPRRALHNASNDARFTLEVFLALVFMTEEQMDTLGNVFSVEPPMTPSWTGGAQADEPCGPSLPVEKRYYDV